MLSKIFWQMQKLLNSKSASEKLGKKTAIQIKCKLKYAAQSSYC